MKVEGVDLDKVALVAATRDLTAPLVLMRQLSYELEGCQTARDAQRVADEIRLTAEKALSVSKELRLALTGQRALTIEPVGLATLCYDVRDELRPMTTAERYRLDITLPRRRPVVAGNYAALRVVLNGFVLDAAKYLPPCMGDADMPLCQQPTEPGVEQLVSTSDEAKERRVRVLVRSSHGAASILVEDYGPAINLRRALDGIRAGDVATPIDGRPLSSRLNLWLANDMLQQMGGQLLAHNHRQGGSTLEMRLPISRQLELSEAE